MADLFLFRSLVGHILILISHRTHNYSDSLYTVLNLYIYLDGGTYHILILLSILYLFRSSVGVTELMLMQRYLYTYWYLYLSRISRRSLQNLCLYRGTLRYYKAYTYTIRLILILQSLHLFGGTRRYYRDITERILVLRNLFLYGVLASTTCSNVSKDTYLCLYQTYI